MCTEVENFVRYSIRYQLLLARQVAHACDSRIYVFDTSGYFKPLEDVTIEAVENVRTVSKHGHRAVLSVAVQEAFGSNDNLFLKFTDEGAVHEDDIGLYVVAPKIVEIVADKEEVAADKEVKDIKESEVEGDLKDISQAMEKLESIL